MQQGYNPAEVENEARNFWDKNGSFRVTEEPGREKFYCLSMFPYPSGKLHMGHVRNYTIGDVIARYQRMLGKNVLQPMGWDAFGLPAEGAAIKNNMPPANWTYSNIDYMKGQLKQLGFGYDWSRELATCQPEYYRWEQWLFTELYRKELVYKKDAMVNWDPIDQTVLANEQVIDGRGWRSGALVERRKIAQWFIKITDYAEELLQELESMEEWPEKVRTMQRNWIGRSKGVQMEFATADHEDRLTIFTTRPDTLMGVTYLAVAAEHPLALATADSNPELQEFIAECGQGSTSEADMETMEKRGMRLGIDAIHPISGETVPIFVANFVLMGYGTGAVMAVPAHDQRDWEFAHKYGVPIKQVVFSPDGSDCSIEQAAYTDKGVLGNSGEFDGLDFTAACSAIADHLVANNRGERQINYRLRDWGVSRQRYWGAPIPMIHCPQCGTVPVPAEDLPVVLPEDIKFDATGGSPLKKMPQWYRTNCPECNGDAERETDTFDTFMESSWYYARYTCPDATDSMLDERADYWLPVDHYIGGIEHAILHLLYARFYHKLMRDAGLIKSDEPFTKLLTQGMVIADTYFRTGEDGQKEWYNHAEVEVKHDDKGRAISATLQTDGQPVEVGGIEKMSKSKNNGIDPQAMVEQYGADTVRLYTMFTAPPDQSLEWSDEGVDGAHRFLRRLWDFVFAYTDDLRINTSNSISLRDGETPQKDARREIHLALKQATFDYERTQFNTVVSAGMKILNQLPKLVVIAQKKGNDAGTQAENSQEKRLVMTEGVSILLRLLAPIAPHITHHLWRELGFGDDILDSDWPEPDEGALKQDNIQYVIQVNGKVRSRMEMPIDADRDTIEAAVLKDEKTNQFIADATVRKIIVVPGKLVNIVAK